MAKKIGLIGVPLEDLCVWGHYDLVSTYIPHITDSLRKEIIDKASERDVKVKDLGEVFLGEDYPRPYPTDRYEAVHNRYDWVMRWRDMGLLEQARHDVLKKSEEFDLLVAVGHSHLGAIVLYDNSEKVARLDYHSDYTKLRSAMDDKRPDYESLRINFACYMNWVEHNLIGTEVTNYFAKCYDDEYPGQKIPMPVFGRRAEFPDGKDYKSATHFDIDVDCVDARFHVQDCYSQEEQYGGPTGASPDDVVAMVGEARPNKLGFWEYRLGHDMSRGRKGVKMIADSIVAATGR
jgi:hypothetical protein